ncbi:hypothetical protein D3C85_1639140 [compost metagenome]
MPAVDERQADPLASGVVSGAGLGQEPQSVADHAVRQHRAIDANAGQFVMDGLVFGSAVDDGAHVRRPRRTQAPA